VAQADEPVDPSTLEAHESLSDTALTRILDRLADVDAIELDADGIVRAASPDGNPAEIAAQAVAAQGELRQYEQSRLEMMRQYAGLETCRRAFLLRCFDQDAPERCDACDNCDSGRTEAATVADQRYPDNAEVTHAEWGDGKVIKNEEDTVTVRFDSVGYKTLAVELVEKEGLLTCKGEG
jgi:ATP-dependent DNA helicase RecQ